MAALGGSLVLFSNASFSGLGHLELDLHQVEQIAWSPADIEPEILLIVADGRTSRRLDPTLDSDRIPRRFFAKLVTGLRNAGARLLVLDFAFEPYSATPSLRLQKETDLLRKALVEAAPMPVVVSAPGEVFGEEEPFQFAFYETEALPDPLPALVVRASPFGNRYDDQLRSFSVLCRDSETGEVLESLSFAAYRLLVDPAGTAPAWNPDADRVRVNGRTLALGDAGDLFIRWPSKPGRFETVRLEDAIRELNDEVKRIRYRDRIVFVGTTKADSAVTAIGTIPGVETHAIALNALLESPGKLCVPLPLEISMAWGFFLSLLAAYGVRTFSVSPAATLGLALALAFGVPIAVYLTQSLWLETVLPALSVATSAALGLLWETRALRRFEPAAFRNAARREEVVTVLFADLAGSTAVISPIGAVAAGRLLSRALRTMVRQVERYGGEVERTLGDGLMAIFRGPDAPKQAVDAARDLSSAFPNATSPWRVRVGIESGPVAGGVVSARHFAEFSSFGPAVHLASRLQAACEEEGQPVLVGPAAAAAMATKMIVRPWRALTLKGFSDPVAVFVLNFNESRRN